MRRRGGARQVTLGFVAVGVSSFVLLGAGPRLLGTDAFSGLGLVWTVSTVFGIGLGAPTEQLISRRLNAGAPHAVGVPLRWLAAVGLVAALVALVVGGSTPSARSLQLLGPGMAVAVSGWVAAVPVRGRLAGAGDLTAYCQVLLVEALARVVLVGLAVAVPSTAPTLLPAAVGLPLLLAAAAAMVRWRAEPEAQHEPLAGADVRGHLLEHLAFVAVSCGFQVALNGAPLLLEWRSGDAHPAVVGAFVAVSTYFRAPAILVGGIATSALVALSRAWSAEDLSGFSTALARAHRQALIVSGGGVAAVSVLAPLLLPVYYGADLGLPAAVLVALPVSTLVAAIGSVAVTPLMAAGRSPTAGMLWVVGAILTCALLALSSAVDSWTAAGLVAGPALALAGAVLATRVVVQRARVGALR